MGDKPQRKPRYRVELADETTWMRAVLSWAFTLVVFAVMCTACYYQYTVFKEMYLRVAHDYNESQTIVSKMPGLAHLNKGRDLWQNCTETLAQNPWSRAFKLYYESSTLFTVMTARTWTAFGAWFALTALCIVLFFNTVYNYMMTRHFMNKAQSYARETISQARQLTLSSGIPLDETINMTTNILSTE